MSTIIKYIFENKTTLPILYIDSINKNSHITEMINYLLRYIRETTHTEIVNRDNYIANDSDDIYKNKKDGYWIITNEQKNEVILYMRETIKGILYNSIYVNEIFRLNSYECPRIVPKILTKTTLFENFTDELKATVHNYKTRTVV